MNSSKEWDIFTITDSLITTGHTDQEGSSPGSVVGQPIVCIIIICSNKHQLNALESNLASWETKQVEILCLGTFP